MVDPMVVDPVVRNVVDGSVPLDERVPYAVVASVDLKDGVETPLSQLLAAETVEEPSPSWCWSPPPWSADQNTVDRLELAADGTSTPAVPTPESIRPVRTESEPRE
jgi:hypothetical protein